MIRLCTGLPLALVLVWATPAIAKERPKSLEALTSAALAAIKKGDADAYVRLLFKRADIKKHCPKNLKDMTPAYLARFHEEVRKRVKECKGLLDWSKAKQKRKEGGKKKGVALGCATVVEHKEIKVYFAVGGKTYRIKLDAPVVFGGKHFAFADPPRCREELK